ncbi:Protein of unknown function [Gryllus bimaculatus]|nr:Protein of unknown function [Gryllus bimaculatus]
MDMDFWGEVEDIVEMGTRYLAPIKYEFPCYPVPTNDHSSWCAQEPQWSRTVGRWSSPEHSAPEPGQVEQQVGGDGDGRHLHQPRQQRQAQHGAAQPAQRRRLQPQPRRRHDQRDRRLPASRTAFSLLSAYGLKDYGDEVAVTAIVDMVNFSLMSGEFQSAWKTALDHPFPKSANSTTPVDYHPIKWVPQGEKNVDTRRGAGAGRGDSGGCRRFASNLARWGWGSNERANKGPVWRTTGQLRRVIVNHSQKRETTK